MTISVSPHEYNNLKLMYYWYACSCILMASWLVWLARVKGWRWPAFGLTVASVFTGMLAVHTELVLRWEIFTRADVQAAVFAKAMTPPQARWLTGLNHNQPIASLAGRTIILGYTGWIASHGYDVSQREADVREMYAGTPRTKALLQQYDVDYIYLSGWEKSQLRANEAWLDANFPRVYDVEGLKIYDTRRQRPDAAG
jgi:hypothetical protein